MEFDVGGAPAETLLERETCVGGIEFVFGAGDVQERGRDRGGLAVFPVFRYAAAEADDAADGVGIGCGEAVVEADGLGEAEQRHAVGRAAVAAFEVIERSEDDAVVDLGVEVGGGSGAPIETDFRGFVVGGEETSVGGFKGGDGGFGAEHLAHEVEHHRRRHAMAVHGEDGGARRIAEAEQIAAGPGEVEAVRSGGSGHQACCTMSAQST